jgi:uncharacterized membrane protein YcaP (DUF421 family)
MWQLAVPWWELVLRPAAVYLALLLMLRVFGKREVGQFTLFDLVLILLVANAVQPAMTGADTSLVGGFIIIVTLIGVNLLVSTARQRIPLVARLLESQPTVIASDGHWIERAIEHEEVTIDEAEMALREHGIADVAEVEMAVLEADGSISVVPKDKSGPMQRRRRRLRIVRHL